jgi:hypothetical protein
VAKQQKLYIILMVMTISFFQVGAIHSYYESLVEADFLGCGLKFEAADLENLFVDKQKNLEIGPGASSNLCSEDVNPSAQFFPLDFRVPSTDQTPFALRC